MGCMSRRGAACDCQPVADDFSPGWYLINKMLHFYHFEKNPPVPVKAHRSLPSAPGFNKELDPAKVESQKALGA
jgi:L-rhamnonate dehydratase